jgi:hypothetical protein
MGSLVELVMISAMSQPDLAFASLRLAISHKQIVITVRAR